MRDKTVFSFKLADLLVENNDPKIEALQSRIRDQWGKYDPETELSLGDIAMKLGAMEAWVCTAFFPEVAIRKVMRAAFPGISRLLKNTTDDKMHLCLKIIEKFMYGNELSDEELKPVVLFSIIPRENDGGLLSIMQTIIYLAIKPILGNADNNATLSISEAALLVLDNAFNVGLEQNLQVEDICIIFPPILNGYHRRQQKVFSEKAILRYKPNWFLKLLGFKYKDGKDFRFKWGSFLPGWGLGIEILEFSDDGDRDQFWHLVFTLIFGTFWINLPKWLPSHDFNDLGQQGIKHWGFSSAAKDGYTRYGWGFKYKFVYHPWQPDHIRTQVLMKDGTWQHEPEWDSVNPTREEFEAQVAREVHSYRYTLENGERQHRLVTIHVVEREWRPKWTKWFPIFKTVYRSVHYQFSDEVGERTGSYKGGVLGSAERMRIDESPEDTLFRMEKTRKFT